jgi:hypothetical protein
MNTDRPADSRRCAFLTWCLALFLVLNGVVLSAVLWLASPPGFKETVLTHSLDVLKGQGGDDSWGVMHVALNYVRAAPATPVYTELFFTQHWRFQYPPSSLFALEGLRLAGPERVRIADGMVFAGWPPVNDLVGWVFIVMTAAATAWLLEFHLRRRNAVTPSAGLRIVRVLVAAGLTLTFYPIVKAYSLGQIQVWINGLFALTLVCWAAERRALAGLLIGTVCLIKPHYALFLLWAMLRREWRFVVAAAATIAVGLAASVAAFGWANHVDYLRVLSFLSQRGEAYFPNQSVNGLLNRLMGVGNPLLYVNLELKAGQFPPFNPWVYGGTLATSAALLLSAIWRRGGNDDRVWDFSRMAVSCTMASPIAWEHHYGVLLPVFAVAFAASVGNRSRIGWLAVSYVLISNFIPATNLLAPSFLNVLQSHLLAGAVILLIILHRHPAPAMRGAQKIPFAAGSSVSRSLPSPA